MAPTVPAAAAPPVDNYRGRSWGKTPVTSQNFRILRHRVRSAKQRRGNDDDDDDPQLDHAIVTKSNHPWLRSADKWEKGFPKGWKAVRILGSGGFGVAGHWKYTSKELPQLGSVETQIKDIVVKQSKAADNNGLRQESKFMEELTRTGSRHFPQLYGSVQRDVGQGTESKVDPKDKEVHRIFMEFCAGGSMDEFLVKETLKRRLGRRRIPEAELWSIFHCFAKAVSVLDQGHEQAELQPPPPQSDLHPWSTNRGIVHFDFKPGNTLIGSHEPPEHGVFPRTMIADFGLSEYITKNWQFDPSVLQQHSGHGTVPWRAPVCYPSQVLRAAY
jgi:serine/threonine protein kinase